MLVLRCSSKRKIEELVSESRKLPFTVLFLLPSAIKTKKELEFSFYLAENAFKRKANISGRMANEVILFLADEKNFSSALRKIGARDNRDFLLISERNERSLKKKLFLQSAKRIRLPEWGRKIGNYSEGELSIEKMAVGRIRN